MTTRLAPRIWNATSMPAVPPSTSRTPSGTPCSHNLRIRIGPTASSQRKMLPQPITRVSHASGAYPSSSSSCGASDAEDIDLSDHSVDDELAQRLAGLPIVGVHRAHQAGIEAPRNLTDLHRVVLV